MGTSDPMVQIEADRTKCRICVKTKDESFLRAICLSARV